MNDRHREPYDDDTSIAAWTRGEKKRVMKATIEHEQSASFWAQIKRIGGTIGAVLTFWLVLKQVIGQGWSDFVAFLGGSSPK